MTRRVRPGAPTTLTPRETEIIDLIRQGYGNKQIAARLQVEQSTIKSHVARLFSRLGATSRTQAVYLHDRQQQERSQ